MALFVLEELASALQRDLDTASATLARDVATALVESLTGPLGSQQSTVTLPLDGTCIDLPSEVVTAVASVSVDGVAAQFEWLRPHPRVRLLSWVLAGYPVTWHTVEVVYTHGFGIVPPVAKAVALEVAKRAYANPSGLRDSRIDDYSESYGPAGGAAGVTLTDLEIRQLERAGLVRSSWVTP